MIIKVNNPFFNCKDVRYCACCSLPEETPKIVEKFKLKVSTKKFASCGIGVFLYFFYIKFIVSILILFSVMITAPSIYYNNYLFKEMISYCTNKTEINACLRYKEINGTLTSNDWLYSMSYLNEMNYQQILSSQFNKTTSEKEIAETLLVDFNLINLISMALAFVGNILFINMMHMYIKEIDLSNTTPADYTAMIYDVRETDDIKEDIKELVFINIFIKTGININSVNYSYKLEDFFKSRKQINKDKKKLKKYPVKKVFY